jgi:hypothetical protein
MPDPKEDYMTAGDGPLSWRDVYRAVNESEERILKAISDAVAPLGQASRDHEERIRAIETGNLAWVLKVREAADKTHEGQGRRIGELENQVNFLTNRESGILSTLGAGRAVILVVVAVAGLVIALTNLTVRLSP